MDMSHFKSILWQKEQNWAAVADPQGGLRGLTSPWLGLCPQSLPPRPLGSLTSTKATRACCEPKCHVEQRLAAQQQGFLTWAPSAHLLPMGRSPEQHTQHQRHCLHHAAVPSPSLPSLCDAPFRPTDNCPLEGHVLSLAMWNLVWIFFADLSLELIWFS